MVRPSPKAVQRVACLGTGVIGGGWVAHFLARGYDVTVWRRTETTEERLRRLINNAWPALQKLGLAPNASRDRLRVAETISEAVADAQFVQESAPERLDLKIELLAEIDAALPPDIVICSSTSGLAMSDIQVACAHPERAVIGHPFNPPYLIPLVEVVGGKKTDPATVDWAAEFYEVTGKSVLKMERELPGFIANRLQEAIFRECLHMVASGEATVEQLDTAISEGPGLRWAIMGPCLTFHLAGGEGGMAQNLDHFGPLLEKPWTRLKAPPLTKELRDRMVEGCERAARGRSIAELVRQRDECLIGILRVLSDYRRRMRQTNPTDSQEGGKSDLEEG